MRKSSLEVQARLADEGFYKGDLDGLWGPLSRLALMLFQRLFGIEPTGELDDETEEELFPEPIDERADGDGGASPDEGADRRWPRYADIEDFYGERGSDQVRLALPFPMKLAWNTSEVITSFYCHRKVHSSLERVFSEIESTFSPRERRDLGLDMYGGCYNNRRMRGGSKWSVHAWAVAVDFDPARNRLKWGRDRARLARPDAEPFWEIWEREGWTSLGRAKNYDWMHVQAVRP